MHADYFSNLLAFILPVLCFALVHSEAAPIPVCSADKDSGGVTLKMEPGVLRLEVCSERIVRVVYCPTELLPATESFVVIHKWTAVPFQLKDADDAVTISTDKLMVKVAKSSGAITFLDASGKVLLQEPADGGKNMTAAEVNNEKSWRVEQSFECPPDEALFGMAQAQDGIWNWRGIPIELRQLNTQVAVPMLVSSKGYGLLWDNASLTEFNPIDTRVPLSTASVAGDDSGAPKATEDLQNAPKKPAAKRAVATGTFTAGEAGEYVFMARDGDRRDELTILIDGREIAGIKNMWVPYTVTGTVKLAANQQVKVTLRGGGKDAKVFARPLGSATTFRSEVGDAIDYTFFYGPALDDVVAGYRLATGAAPMWPKWAYGFWQCRERYSSQDQIVKTVAEFRKRAIPVDLLVQDWQYWGRHGWGAYEWDESKYPDPAAMIKALHEMNTRFMISVWSNPQGEVEKALKAMDGLIPGSRWMDVYNPKVRALRWEFMNKAFFSAGTDAWWQDATEPGDDGNSVNNCRIFPGSANRFRNAYPLFASQATYEGQRGQSPQKRVVNLTRSAYPGMQRYGAGAWSGDVNGDWKTFKRQIAAGLNFCLTGQPYWTTDTGGFFRPRNQHQSPEYNELLTRWFQWSTFMPILRIHGYQTETEMWKWLPETQRILLAFDTLRYRMLPYNYSVAWMVTSKGYTIMRALPMDFPGDPKATAIADEYMFGPAFLVAPVTTPGSDAARQVYLPAGTEWFDFWTGEKRNGGAEVEVAATLDTIPLFVRAGAIVPLGPALQHANEKPDDPIELRVYRGADGDFTLYEDEGDNYNYERGVHATIPIRWDEKRAILTIGERVGSFPGMMNHRTFRVVWVRPGTGTGISPAEKPDHEVRYDGRAVAIRAPAL